MTALAELNFDLKQLPIRAMLAYAARCARRAQPQFKLSPKHRDAAACKKAVESSIRLAEVFVAGGEIDRQVVAQIEEIMVHALMAVSAEGETEKTAAYAATAAYAVISATSAALEIEDAVDPTEYANRVLDACVTATESAISTDAAVERAARLDWEMLHRMRLGKYPDLGEPINPAESGILGPLYCSKTRVHRSRPPQNTPSTQSSTEAARDDQHATAENIELAASETRSAAEKESRERTARKAKSVAARIRTRREKLAADWAKIQTERDSLAAEQQSLAAERQVLVERQQSREAETSRAEAELAALLNELQQLHEQISQVETERSQLGEQLTSLQSEYAQLQELQAEWEAARQQWQCEEEQRTQRDEQIQARGEELATLEATLSARQNDVESMARQLDKRSLELAAVQERLDETREALERDRNELQSQIVACRDKAALLDEKQRQLETENARAAVANEKIKRVLRRLAKRGKQLAEKKAEIRNEHELILKEIERHQQSVDAKQQYAENSSEQNQELDRQRQELEQTRKELEAQKLQLDSDQTSLEEVHAQLTTEHERIAATKAECEAERQRLKAEAKHLQEERELLALHQTDVEAEKQKLEQGLAELQQQKDACEAEHIQLLDEKDEVARKESELAKFHADGDKAGQSTEGTGPLDDKNANEVKGLLAQLQEERKELRTERAHLSELIAQLNSLRPQRRDPALDPEGSGSNLGEDAFTLTFLLETGTAKAAQLGEMLGLLSSLYQVFGGEGLEFEICECRLWSYGESQTPSKRKAARERVFAELIARASRTRIAEPDPTLWERFTSTLVTTVRFDTRLTDYFNLGDVLEHNHALVAPVSKAIESVARDQQDDITKKGGKWSLSIDAVTLQRKRIESLRAKLERECHTSLELAGAGGSVNLIRHRQKNSSEKGTGKSAASKEAAKPKKRRGRKLLAIGSLIAVIAIITGICVL